jgi:hypothetical protein
MDENGELELEIDRTRDQLAKTRLEVDDANRRTDYVQEKLNKAIYAQATDYQTKTF